MKALPLLVFLAAVIALALQATALLGDALIGSILALTLAVPLMPVLGSLSAER